MLFRMACLYHSIEGTSCQAERNFSALASMLSDLRSRLTPFAVCMLLRLNCNRVTGVDLLAEAGEAKAATRARVTKQVAEAQRNF
ncbi:unnamed protein product [Phaeothamnion confervicola]